MVVVAVVVVVVAVEVVVETLVVFCGDCSSVASLVSNIGRYGRRVSGCRFSLTYTHIHIHREIRTSIIDMYVAGPMYG